MEPPQKTKFFWLRP